MSRVRDPSPAPNPTSCLALLSAFQARLARRLSRGCYNAQPAEWRCEGSSTSPGVGDPRGGTSPRSRSNLIASATRPPQTLGMDWKVVIAAVGAVVLLVLVTYGSRRVSAGEGRFVWLRSAHLLVGAGMILWGGVYILANEPLVGVVLLVV